MLLDLSNLSLNATWHLIEMKCLLGDRVVSEPPWPERRSCPLGSFHYLQYFFFFLWLNSRLCHDSLKLVLALSMPPGMLQVLNGYLWEERIRESRRQASQKATGRWGVPVRSQTHSVSFLYLSPCISLASHALSKSLSPLESLGVKDAVREYRLLFSTKSPLQVAHSIIWSVSMTQGLLSVRPASYS